MLLLLTIVGLLGLIVAHENNSPDPMKTFCRRFQHQTCIIDSKLYVDGGLVYYGSGVDNSSTPELNMRSLSYDLSDLSEGVPSKYDYLSDRSNAPVVKGGALWPDHVNKLFYLFGGEFESSTATKSFDELWFYDTISNTWNESKPLGTQVQIKWPAYGASTVTDGGVAYYLGGWLNENTVSGWRGEPLMLNTIVSYDMMSNEWTNRTFLDGTPRAEGTLTYLPVSDRGMLAYMGGLETSTSGTVAHADMSRIQLYDISIDKWYTQTATGDVPQKRSRFCSGIVWAKDRSSYSIYIYGGLGENDTALADVYVLSMPSFRWFSLYPRPQLNVFPGGKFAASCDIIQDSQMIVMGGEWTNKSKVNCDGSPKTGGQHGLLLGQEGYSINSDEDKDQWWGGLKSNITSYQVPNNITAVIGGAADGRATVTAPAAGWETSDLANYFTKPYTAPVRTPTRSIPASSSSSSTSKSNVGAIAGGVVGGVVVLVSIMVLAWFCLRRRRNQKQSAEGTSSLPPHVEPQQGSGTPVNEKYPVSPTTASYISSFPSPSPHAAAYTPQASPPPPAWSERHTPSTYYEGSPPMPQQAWGAHEMPIQYANQQPYYPPPPDPSQSPSKHAYMADAHAELSGIKSPVNEMAEMPEVRSPVPKRGL